MRVRLNAALLAKLNRGRGRRRQPREFPIKLPPGAGGVFSVTIAGWQPTRLNQLLHARHWSVAQRLKNSDALTIAEHLQRAGVTAAAGKRLVRLTITLAPRQRAGDPDAYWKVVLDGLKRCGALRDDNRTWCTYEPPEFVRGAAKATTIGLEDLGPEGSS